jgi:ribosomal protein L37AE/L43A
MLEVQHQCEKCDYPAVVRLPRSGALSLVVWRCTQCGHGNVTGWNFRTMEGAGAEVGFFGEQKKRRGRRR